VLIGVASFQLAAADRACVMNALKTTVEIGANPLAFPTELHWKILRRPGATPRSAEPAAQRPPLRDIGGTILMCCGCATATADALRCVARQRASSGVFITFYFMATITVPVQLYLYPLYFIFSKLGFVNSIPGRGAIYTAMFSPFAIFLLRTYPCRYRSHSRKRRQVDGATRWEVFVHVILR